MYLVILLLMVNYLSALCRQPYIKLGTRKQLGTANHKKTSDAGSQYQVGKDGWAGASNSHLHLNPHKHKEKYSKRSFFLFLTQSVPIDGWTDGQTDGRTKPLIELRVRN